MDSTNKPACVFVYWLYQALHLNVADFFSSEGYNSWGGNPQLCLVQAIKFALCPGFVMAMRKLDFQNLINVNITLVWM